LRATGMTIARTAEPVVCNIVQGTRVAAPQHGKVATAEPPDR